MSSDRFDLLGNSLAILTGIASPQCATNMLTWIEAECEAMRDRGELTVDLPPCLFPYILPHHADWLPRYERYNRPGDYHNGGVWPFICGFYVAACVASGQMDLAERKLLALTELVKPWHEKAAEVGFQRMDSCANRQAQRPGLANLVGRNVLICCGVCVAARHTVLRRYTRGQSGCSNVVPERAKHTAESWPALPTSPGLSSCSGRNDG